MQMKCVLSVLAALFAIAQTLPINDDRPPVQDDVGEPSNGVSRIPATMSLPSNATAIRADITDTFSCDGKIYGYYADVDNDCQIFHICLPVTYADGKENMFRWSFVCPDETIFSQELFTCIRPADWTSDCSDSSKFVALNRQFGSVGAGDDDPLHADEQTLDIGTNSIRNEEISAAVASTKLVAEAVRPEASELRLVIADVQPDVSQLEVKVYTQPESTMAVQPATHDNSFEELPVYDADTSETQSFGLFKIIGEGAHPKAEMTDAKAVDQPAIDESLHRRTVAYDADSVNVVAVEQSKPEQPAADVEQVKSLIPVIDNAIEADLAVVQSVPANEIDLPVVAEPAVESSEHVSTELWNHFTHTVYDGGLTIDDNVEVNALPETSEQSGGASTEVSEAVQ